MNVYIGKKKCGCIRAVVIDDQNYTNETAATVCDIIKSGLIVTSLTCEEARNIHWRCEGCSREKELRT